MHVRVGVFLYLWVCAEMQSNMYEHFTCMANVVVGIYASSVLKQRAGVCNSFSCTCRQVLGVCVLTVRLFLPHVADEKN
jgi:hypothetical protein